MALDILRNSPAALVASLAYDYNRIADPDSRAAMQAAALEIKPRLKRMVVDIVEAGRQLLTVRDLCPHGEWEGWLGTEFELSDRMARHWMATAERFGDKSEKFSDLPLSALYQLAAPSTPEAAVAEVEAKIAKGERPKLAEVKATIAQHKPSPAPAPAQPPRVADVVAQVAERMQAGGGGPVDVSDEGQEWARLQAAHMALSGARIQIEGVLDVFEDYGFGQEAERTLRALFDLREEVRGLRPKDKIGGAR